jgi:hypothetical protein
LKTVFEENLGISTLLKLPATTCPVLTKNCVIFTLGSSLRTVAVGWREGWGYEDDSKKAWSCSSMFPLDYSRMLLRMRSK